MLNRFLRNECTEAETRQVHELLRHGDKDETLSGWMEEAWEALQLYPELPANKAHAMFQAILRRTVGSRQAERVSQNKSAVRRLPSWQVAASLAGFCLMAGLVYLMWFNNPVLKIETGYGKMATISLPDKSLVYLNGNSRIRYHKNWNNSSSREVWLEGEAFFSVVHTSGNTKFLVHTGDKEQVEVLGTTFTVARRKFGTRVVLNTGRVNFQGLAGNKPRAMVLKPGDLVEVKAGTGKWAKRSVDPRAYCSWVHKKMVFDNTPLQEVVAVLEDTYGLKVKVVSADIYEKRVSGSTPSDNINLFLAGLERSLELDISRKGNLVLIKNNQENP